MNQILHLQRPGAATGLPAKAGFLLKTKGWSTALCLTLLSVLLSVTGAMAQLSGTKTIPGDYATVQAAISALNTQGVAAAGVTFNIGAGIAYTETFTSATAGQITVTAGNPVTFQKAATATANPVLTAAAGTTTTLDAIISLVGSDNVTFDGINLVDPASNATATTAMEFGFALFRTGSGATANGCQNNTFKNGSITLQRTVPTSSNSAAIYGADHTNASTTALTSTGLTATAPNSGNKFYNNTIQNAQYGLNFRGISDASPYTYYDQGNDVGGSSAATGNTIQNYGNTNNVAGVRAIFQNNLNASYNTISNAAGGGVGAPTTSYGIYQSSGVNASATFSNNTITILQGSNSSQISGIKFDPTGTGSFTANGNTINLTTAAASTNTIYGIYPGSGGGITGATGVTMNSNSFNYSLTSHSSGTVYGLYTGSSAHSSVTLNSNQMLNNTALGTTSTFYFINTNNTTNNVTLQNNTINNVNKTGSGGTFYGIYDFGSPTGGTASVTGNSITNITLAGTASFYGIYYATDYPQSTTVSNNTVSDVVSGASLISGTVNGLHIGYGNAASFTSTSGNYSQNTIFNLNGGIVNGINVVGSTNAAVRSNVHRNKIYNLTANGTSGVVSGINVASGLANYIYNNLIGNLSATASTSATAVNGIHVSSTTASTSAYLYFNTIYVNNPSGTGGTSGIYLASTSPVVDIRNNIVSNSSASTGINAGLRRTAVALTGYSANSNNNLWNAPVLYYDGTTQYTTLAGFKAQVSPRESNSVSEIPTFISTTGSNANFLHINTSAPTLVESGGVAISGLTTDFDAVSRLSPPDIGADEGTFTAPSGCSGTPVAGAIAPAGPLTVCPGSALSFTLSGYATDPGITLQWQDSVSSGTWTNIASATSVTYATTSAAVTKFYRVRVTCTNSSLSSVSNTVRVNVQAPTYLTPTLPYTQSFDSWVNNCATTDAPSAEWRGTPFTGNAAWRRQDQGASAGWNSPATFTVTPLTGAGAADFHSPYATPAGTQGSLDLYLNLSGNTSLLQVQFDYINAGGTDVLDVLYSTDGGANFSSSVATLGVAATWTHQYINLPVVLSSATTVIRLRGTSDGGASDIGVDNFSLSVALPALSGIYTIDNTNPTAGTNFNSFADAILALNSRGTSGAVTFNVFAGQTFNEAPQVIASTINGALGAEITFQKFNSGANPVFRGTTGTGSSDYMITLNGNDYIVFDGIDFLDNPANVTATTKMEAALRINGLASNGARNNTVKNGTITLDKSNTNATYGIYLSSTATAAGGTNEGNKFQNNIISNSQQGVLLSGISGFADNGNQVTGNTITNIGTTSGGAYGIQFSFQTGMVISGNTLNTFASGTSIYGIYSSSGTATNTVQVNNNTLSGFTQSSTGNVNPISIGGVSGSIYSNTISAMTTSSSGAVNGIIMNSGNIDVYSNTISGLTAAGSGAITGITISSSGSANVRDNTISGLSTTSSGAVIGLSVSAGSHNVFRNKISDLSSTSASAVMSGLLISGGTTHAVYNNMISDLRAFAATGTNPNVRGAALTGGTTVSFYHNTVFLTGTATAAAHHSAALYFTTGPTSVDLRNNILVNTTVPGSGTSREVAIYRTSATYTNYATTSNNNLVYAGVPSAKSLLFYDGTNSETTLAGFKARVATREAASVTELPPFVSTTPGSTDVHITPGANTQVESGAQPIASVDTDFDNQPRQNNGSYTGAGTAPDLGADEGAFQPAVPIAISNVVYNQFGGNTARNATNQLVTRLDVNVTGTLGTLTLDSVRINLGSTNLADVTNVKFYSSPSATFSIGTATVLATTGAIASPSYLLKLSAPATLVAGVNYFYVTYDITGTATANNTVEAPIAMIYAGGSGTIATLSGPAAQLTILGPLNGTYTVGAGGTYSTITAANADLALRGVSGNVIFSLINDAATPYSAANGETFPITIAPFNGAGAGATVTFKPAAGKQPVITGSSTTAIITLSGADYVIIDGSNTTNGTSRDLTISNTSTAGSTAVIWVSSQSAANGAANTTFRNLNVVAGSNTVASTYGIYAAGTSISSTGTGADNDNLTISNNYFTRAYSAIYARGVASTGLLDNLIISNNTIGTSNIAATTDAVSFRGIDVTNAVAPQIMGNEIQNMVTAIAANIAAIDLGANVTNALVSRNSVHDLDNTNASAYGAYGVNISASTTSGIQIDNNLIARLSGYGYLTSTSDNAFGIRITGGAAHKVYFNTVNMNGAFSTTAGISAALIVTAGTALDVRNNIFVNSMTKTGGAGPVGYAMFTSTGVTFATINYNNYFVSGTGNVLASIAGTVRTDLAGIRTATGQDMNSYSVDPLFNSSLVPDACQFDGSGTAIAGITTDFNGVTRTAIPDLGAIEFTPATSLTDLSLTALTVPTGPACLSNAETVSITVQNSGCNDLTFSPAAPLTLTVDVTGAVTTQLQLVLTTGTLAKNSIVTYPLSNAFDMSTGGTYTFTPSLTLTADQVSSNNTLPAGNVVSTRPNLTASATPAAICTNGTSTISSVSSVGTVGTSASPTTTVNGNIPDGSLTGVSSGITIATGSSGTVSASTTIQVKLNIDHNFLSDVDIYLVGPGNFGTLELSTDNGSSDDDYINTVFNTAASTLITSGAAPFTNTYLPEKTITTAPTLASGVSGGTYSLPATALNGAPINGTWTLWVFDDGTFVDAGKLIDWNLSITDASIGYTTSFTGPGTISAVTYSGTNKANAQVTVSGLSAGTHTYTVTTTDIAGCSKSTAVNLTVNPQPVAQTLTGGGAYCAGGVGSEIGLASSEAGVEYQLMRGATAVGSPVTGTGSAISFGFQTVAGTYTYTANNTTTSCTSAPSGSVAVSINPLPTAYTVTGGGGNCVGGSGVAVGLSGSQTGVDYELFVDGLTTGTLVSGTNGAISFGIQAMNGVYTVEATNTTTTCTNSMTGSVSITTVTTTTWTGTVSTDWNDAANWTNCVPSFAIDVTIPAGAPRYPVITATGETKDLTIASGASLTVNGLLTVYGDFTNNGTFTSGSSSLVLFSGTAAQQIFGTTITTFNDLTFNGSGPYSLNNSMNVNGTLTMSTGIFTVMSSNFTIALGTTGSIVESETSYVIGNVSALRTLALSNEDFGGLGLEIDAAANAPGQVTVVRTTGTILNGQGTSESIARYFTITAANNANLDATVVFHYFQHELNGIPEADLAVFRSPNLGDGFSNQYGTPSAPANQVTLLNVMGFGQNGSPSGLYTLGDGNLNPLPVVLTAFTAKRVNQNALINWTTVSEKENAGFEVAVSTDQHTFRTIGKVNPVSANGRGQEYSFTDTEAGKSGVRYYRLTQIDLNGTRNNLGVRSVTFDGLSSSLGATPNPTFSSFTASVNLAEAQHVTLTLTDVLGRVVSQRTVQLSAGQTQLSYELTNQTAGMYLLSAQLADQTLQVKVVKQ